MKFIFYIFLFITTESFSQISFSIVSTIDNESDFFTTDNQSNVYVVKGNELEKYNKYGKLLYKYSNKNFGNITFVDASNMLKILVFYKDFLQVIFLDNTLSLNGEPVSLESIGFNQTQLVCTSHNSGIWIYDQQNFELIRFNQTLDIAQRTGNLSSVLNMNLQPTFLFEYDNKIYFNNPSIGIIIFDIYGTYYKTIPLLNVKFFQPVADWIYFISDKKAKAYNFKTTEEKQFEMPLDEFINYRIENDYLILQTKKAITIYQNK